LLTVLIPKQNWQDVRRPGPNLRVAHLLLATFVVDREPMIFRDHVDMRSFRFAMPRTQHIHSRPKGFGLCMLLLSGDMSRNPAPFAFIRAPAAWFNYKTLT